MGDTMPDRHHILILGASYGSLLGTRLALAGHRVHLVCLPQEAEAINRNGVVLRMPLRGREQPILIESKKFTDTLTAGDPRSVDVNRYDLVALAMQEPQYRQQEVRALMSRIAPVGIPCVSIMNMPPLPYIKRIPNLDVNSLRDCYTDASVWDKFDPALMTMCSPDPQAFRPPGEPINLLQVTLPTNFKAAHFEQRAHTDMLRALAQNIVDTRIEIDGDSVELPVKLRVYDSIFVPMAKWSMLLTGNYRCIEGEQMRSIRDAVHNDIGESRLIYEWVAALCIALGARRSDLVPFQKYADAALGLIKPSSAARALDAGAEHIERVDLLVKKIALQKGLGDAAIDAIVDRVDAQLTRNRTQMAS